MSQAHLDHQRQLLLMTQELAADSRGALQAAVLVDAPLVRRQLFRTFFAEIEGTVWGYKYFAVASHETDGPKLSVPDLALAREESYELDVKGEAVTKNARLRFAPNLLFGLRLLATYYKPGWTPPTSDNRWQSLLRAAKVRDRLMHPKSLANLEVTDDEMLELAQGYDWFLSCQAELFDGPPAPNPGPGERLLRERLAR